jgi:hypothetical protein
MSKPVPDYVEISDSVLCQSVHDEHVLLNMDSQQYYGLNPVASEMWNRLVELHDVRIVESALCSEFDAEPDLVREDLHRLISDLMDAGLLIPKAAG